ncbi:hypothetical protein C7M61_003371 [Candidozyma pseudohaemuli]|uniref:RNA exonuclease 4 n=1 Tax=Candidozyma pseudohaemuli TaxID=418784 RepID=A0A2P7YNW5_9ASCO|nr:hypothetical protein C7M61_003371 [[Candida] pseudohaemulonii]PSK37664.1 hypothetical protein C7M61_003371 [[Candida] pseudohaemulonii]
MGLSENWKRLSAKQNASSPKKDKHILKIRKRSIAKATPKEREKPVKRLNQQKTPLEVYLWGKDNNNPAKEAVGKFVAIDCEFVGIGDNDESALARVSIVNYYGVLLLDTFVKPQGRVTNWRTWVSGVAPHHMAEAIPFAEAQKKVESLIKGKFLVGHALGGDLKCLELKHPRNKIRDTSKYSGFRVETKGHPPSLKKLVSQYFKYDIQKGLHSSVEDARATMALFRKFKSEIDQEAIAKYK